MSSDLRVGVKPLDLDTIIGKVKNRIHRVGVELEGGWSNLNRETHLEHDGSVQELRCPPGAPNWRTGELPSPVLQPSQMARWIKKYYPDVVNRTCGLHVHMSFSSIYHYQSLMVPDYPVTINHYVREWAKAEGFQPAHHMFKRLNGASEFCAPNFWPDEQARHTKDHNRNREGNRYTDINYCWSVFDGTMECRLLPMMDTAEQAILAVKLILDVTNACVFSLAVKNRGRRRLTEAFDLGADVRFESSNIILSPSQVEESEILL